MLVVRTMIEMGRLQPPAYCCPQPGFQTKAAQDVARL